MRLSTRIFIAVFSLALAPACAGKPQPVERFAEHQKLKVAEQSAYVQADFDFWAALYEPTLDDLEGLRQAWIEHGEAFPESKPIEEIETELRKKSQRVVLVALFRTSYDTADLRDKSLGWTTHPVPVKITELPENDVVLRRLMPVKNPWARYFLLRFAAQTWGQTSQLVISNATSRVELKRWQFNP